MKNTSPYKEARAFFASLEACINNQILREEKSSRVDPIEHAVNELSRVRGVNFYEVLIRYARELPLIRGVRFSEVLQRYAEFDCSSAVTAVFKNEEALTNHLTFGLPGRFYARLSRELGVSEGVVRYRLKQSLLFVVLWLRENRPDFFDRQEQEGAA